MNELVSAYEQPIKFTMGFAGSGKSTELAKEAKEANEHCLVLTPTHKARLVLEAKGVENVYTIHAVLKLVPTLNQNFRKGQKLKNLVRVGTVELDTISKVIIDEFSMINTQIMDLLLELLPDTVEVHIFGDPYQLPPVDGEPIDPLDYTEDITELVKQHRADNPNVVDSFMRFATYLKDGSQLDLTLDNLPTITETELSKRFNPDTERIIAYTNERVIELNSLIEKPTLSKGDNILINGLEATIIEQGHGKYQGIYPSMISKGHLDMDKRMDIEANLTKYNGWAVVEQYDKLVVLIDGDLYNLYYDLEHYYNNKGLEDDVQEAQHRVVTSNGLNPDVDLPKWCRNNKSSQGVRRRGEAWQEYISHTANVFDLRYPFATTVHKSQGQEFDIVYIDQTNMKKAIRNGYIDQYVRLMYVAISRSIHNCFIIK